MPSLWPRILRAFSPPWRIVRRKGGGMWIESKTGRVLLYVYPQAQSEHRLQEADRGRGARYRARDCQAFETPAPAEAVLLGAAERSGRGAGRDSAPCERQLGLFQRIEYPLYVWT